MSKHTPGPWASNKYTTSVSVPLKAIDCERIGFSIVFVNGHREKEAAANARLIAAAPELLEVVQKFVAWSEAERDPSGTTFWQRVEMCREVDALAHAAIAKATGEQP